MTFAHHYAAQYDEGCGAESKFLGTQQGHADDVAAGLQLAVGLQAYLSAQAVQYQCLLCFAQTYFR